MRIIEQDFSPFHLINFYGRRNFSLIKNIEENEWKSFSSENKDVGLYECNYIETNIPCSLILRKENGSKVFEIIECHRLLFRLDEYETMKNFNLPYKYSIYEKEFFQTDIKEKMMEVAENKLYNLSNFAIHGFWITNPNTNVYDKFLVLDIVNLDNFESLSTFDRVNLCMAMGLEHTPFVNIDEEGNPVLLKMEQFLIKKNNSDINININGYKFLNPLETTIENTFRLRDNTPFYFYREKNTMVVKSLLFRNMKNGKYAFKTTYSFG